MKISRKMKKIFVTFLTATLSIIMFATQTSALNVLTRRAEFTDDRQILQATEWNIMKPSALHREKAIL